MIVLHYTLGFPPYRSGGLVKYAMDLMKAELSLGHRVVALYPGGTSFLVGGCTVHWDKNNNGIDTYEMSNPLPVPLLYGIKDIKRTIISSHLNKKSFICMLDNVKPNVIHIHTLMGLPLEYLQIVHERKIRIVYTSHDYFGLCPKVNFINQDGAICQGASAGRCAVCNVCAKSTLFLRVRNAKWVVPLKSIVRRMKL